MGVGAWLIMAIGPAAALMAYFYWRDRYEPEPLGLLLKVMLFGALSVIPAGIVEVLAGVKPSAPVAVAVMQAFLVIAVTEELVKFSVVRGVVYKHPEFDEPSDGITYAVAASLGFAAVENVLYVLGQKSVAQGISVALVRAVLSVPMHCLTGVVMGYFIGLARFSDSKRREHRLLLLAVVAAVLLHGAFDAMIFSHHPAGTVIEILILWMVALRLVTRAQALSPFKPGAAIASTPPGLNAPQSVSPSDCERVCPRCLRPWPPGATSCPGCHYSPPET